MLLALLLAAAAQAPQAAGLTWTAPPEWTAEPPSSSMRVVTYRIAGDVEPAELGVFFFGSGGQGGSVDANVQRWIGQFAPESGSAKPSQRVETINGIRV